MASRENKQNVHFVVSLFIILIYKIEFHQYLPFNEKAGSL